MSEHIRAALGSIVEGAPGERPGTPGDAPPPTRRPRRPAPDTPGDQMDLFTGDR